MRKESESRVFLAQAGCQVMMWKVGRHSRSVLPRSTRLLCHQHRFRSYWSSRDVRSTFIEFFQNHHQHQHYPSSSVIPPKGSGTFFTNAGMNQFKPIFMGTTTADSPLHQLKRAVNSQKCIRLSGKHNDLEEVGHDCTHHTFFEMLGSWSFGDYFKKEAVSMAWELMTKVYMIPVDRLYVTYFEGDNSSSLPADLETRELWLEIGVSKDRVLPGSTRDNFWEMGNTGPCGPCTEIHYDFVGGRNAGPLVNTDNHDVVELWNLVFMQHNRLGDEEMEALPSQHVDTGMGLERLVSVLQNKRSNYDSDLFAPLIDQISQHAQNAVYGGSLSSQSDIGYRIVADHARMMCVCIADGIQPANQGQDGLSFKLRQMMFRSFKHQRKYLSCLPMTSVYLVDPVINTLGEAFPELCHNSELIKEVIAREENSYYEYVSDAFSLLKKFTRSHPDVKVLEGEHLMELRYADGNLDQASVEILAEVAEEFGLTVDYVPTSFDVESAPQVNRLGTKLASYLARKTTPATDDSFKYDVKVNDMGEHEWSSCTAKVLLLSVGEKVVDSVTADDDSQSAAKSTTCDQSEVVLVSDRTCFYSEGGGQAADVGTISNKGCKLVVTDVQMYGQHVLHKGHLESGTIKVGDQVALSIDQDRRTDCARNHTATHLLGHALRQVLSAEVQQAGSAITSNELTFTFTHQGSVSLGLLADVSQLVKAAVANATDITTTDVPYASVCERKDVIRLPGHQYPNTVRVVGVGPVKQALMEGHIGFSTELCGGTHVANTSHIKDFVITGLSGQQQGVKKVTAVTGAHALTSTDLINSLHTRVARLEEDVSNDTDRPSWSGRLREIYQTIGSEGSKLPKVDRELLLKKLEKSKAVQVIRGLNKQAEREKLAQVVSDLIKGGEGEPAIVSYVKVKDLRQVAQVLRDLSPDVPVCIYNTQRGFQHPSQLLCYSPSNQSQAWLARLSERLDSDVQPVKGKKMANICSMKIPAHVDNIKDMIQECVTSCDSAKENVSS